MPAPNPVPAWFFSSLKPINRSRDRPKYLTVAYSLRQAFNVMVAAMVMFSCLLAEPANAVGAPTSVLSIRNGFPVKLSIKCDSDTEQHPPHLVWPQAVESFPFTPQFHRYWNCTIFTAVQFTQSQEGTFVLYARDFSARSCTPICDWKADVNGLWAPLSIGGQPRLVYDWPDGPAASTTAANNTA